MRWEQNVRTNTQGERKLYISVFCDDCCACHTYCGERKEATAQLHFNGWSIGRTYVVRCRTCTQKQRIAVARAFA